MAERAKDGRSGVKDACKQWSVLELAAAVGQVLDLVDADKPVFGCEGFLQHIKLEVLEANLSVAHAIISSRLACAQRSE
jgi:hypothetical protein